MIITKETIDIKMVLGNIILFSKHADSVKSIYKSSWSVAYVCSALLMS